MVSVTRPQSNTGCARRGESEPDTTSFHFGVAINWISRLFQDEQHKDRVLSDKDVVLPLCQVIQAHSVNNRVRTMQATMPQ